MAVQAVLEEVGIVYSAIELGWAKLAAPLTAEQEQALVAGLKRYDLALLRSKTSILVESIKNEIAGLLQSPHTLQLKLSVHLSQALGYNYTYLANTFSEQEGLTLERYYIAQRVEKVKELIVYEDRPLGEIAYDLSYSSVSHLCLQFKKVTGQTPAEFRKKSKTENFIWRALR